MELNGGNGSENFKPKGVNGLQHKIHNAMKKMGNRCKTCF